MPACHLCPYEAPHDDALARHMQGHRGGDGRAMMTTQRQAHRAAGDDLQRLLEELR